MRRPRLALLLPLTLALLETSMLAGCRPSEPPPRGPAVSSYEVFEAEVMTTRLRVELPRSGDGQAAAEAVFALFREVDAGMSEWKETSPLAAVNRAAGGEPVAVPEDLRALLGRSLEVARRTGGAFDPTWAALWGLWDFRAVEPRLPDPAEVARRAALVDYRRVELDEGAGTVRLPAAGMKLGLGGIAKGWALDRSAALLRRRGIDSFLLVAGGQVLAGGSKVEEAGSRPWRVGIRDPRGEPADLFAELELTDASASTSGDYESYFVIDGRRYHHILDPRSGWPARGLTSATVICADATLADALSTALMVLGPRRGLALAEGMPGVEAVLVDGEGRVRVTSGLGSKLVVRHPPGARRPVGFVRSKR